MIIHQVQQGTKEWKDLRANYFTASEAPAMMGASKYQSRDQLLRQKKTGIVEEVDAATQRLFDKGHHTEELAREILEKRLGEDLFPVVASEGKLLASVDGATMLKDTLFEHKLLNQSVVAQIEAGELEPHYYWQLEHQLLVTGAERVIFVCSDGTEENFHSIEYVSKPERRAQLLAGWDQFERDLANYQPEAPQVAAVGTTPESLPALLVEVTGMVKASNLDQFKQHAMAVIGQIKTNLQDDQDFADAEQTVKWCSAVEERLALVKEQILGQTADIDAVFRTIDEISAQARAKRLELDKLVKTRKQSIRDEIVLNAKKDFEAYLAELEQGFGGKIRMPQVAIDLAGAIKGKRTIASLRDAASTELARAKVEAKLLADKIASNLAVLREQAAGFEFLFADAQLLVQKETEDLLAVIKARIVEHKAQEEKRLEAERERIRQEEQRKLEAYERARQEEERKAEQERRKREEQDRIAAQQAQAGIDKPEQPGMALAIEPDRTVAAVVEQRAAFTVEVVNMLELVKAVANGEAPISVLSVNYDELLKACEAYPLAGCVTKGAK